MSCPAAAEESVRDPGEAEPDVLAHDSFRFPGVDATRPCEVLNVSQGLSTLRSFDVFRLKSFRSFCDGELHAVTFLQRFVTFAEYRRIMNEDVSARSPLNESKPLFVIEPFYFALFFAHKIHSFA